MTKAAIEEVLDRRQKACDRNFQHYQETGYRRYQLAYERAGDIADICRMALLSEEDHQAVGGYRADIAMFADTAIKLLHEYDEEMAKSFFRNIKAYAKMHGLAHDPYDRAGG